MSYRVALVCEDHTLDQFILRPVVEALLRSVGKPRAIVTAVTDPQLRGIGDLKRELCGIVARYSLISDLVIIAVDRDCASDREASMRALLDGCDGAKKALLVVARQELEVWALWGKRDELSTRWADILEECHPKENFFDQILESGDERQPGRGRSRLIARSLENGWSSLAAGCPELAQLEEEVRAHLP